ncbi:programmed cell death protein 2, c-terminal domain-containing protein [Cardiosporidium cionae]|uniref:Programmed cell death protein 2, c-terminal domain-containing protein n=1 Tax=Cardiosporidium cionae TaxID=476202 RepID=A0ABQ7J9W2_9APIC|nr:programmed cell death protein 2, c-terminal domain-containing protein [Cardiosporidium cionae]|eukprot:KAF8820450.1 programmed cell death protein 2, c-terminal domain-containing protein [Cardiosporidium cionae]
MLILTMAAVYMGFLSNHPIRSTNQNNPLMSKVGGKPNWLNGIEPPKFSFCCPEYTPYHSDFHRILYIFGCARSQSCWEKPSNWLALRGIIPVETFTIRPSSEEICKTLDCRTEPVERTSTDILDNFLSVDETRCATQDRIEHAERIPENVQEDSKYQIDHAGLDIIANSAEDCDWMSLAFGNMQSVTNLDKADSAQPLQTLQPKVLQITDSPSGVIKHPISEQYAELEQDSLVTAGHTLQFEPRKVLDSSADIFPVFKIDIQEEVFPEESADYLDHRAKQLLELYKHRESTGTTTREDHADESSISGSIRWNPEEYEKHGHEVFLKFQRQIRNYPNQVIRYSFNGQPLWLNDNSELIRGLPVSLCEKCGAGRIFEMQILPTLLYEVLKRLKSDCKPAGILCLHGGFNWGTILLFSCEQTFYVHTAHLFCVVANLPD